MPGCDRVGASLGRAGRAQLLPAHLAPPPPYRFELLGRREMVETIAILIAPPQPPRSPRDPATRVSGTSGN